MRGAVAGGEGNLATVSGVQGVGGENESAIATARGDVDSEGASEGERCEFGIEAATGQVDRSRLRKGRAQMFAGAALAGVGAVGLGVMVGGLYVQRFSAHELARGVDYPETSLAPLRDQHARGESMLAAGAVTAVFGAVLGVTLMATGAREQRIARSARLASVRVTPSLGGLVLGGRF